MKSLLVFARIIIVGCLWCIVFTEGIRVIMLCNWHFDIFWPDHWRQAWILWKAGWTAHAPKEWAFAILIVTFFPMLITGWWTLCLVSWEDIIYKIIALPVTLYRYFIKKPINILTTNNQYGVVKRKSYKQIRPSGVGSRLQTPISDYGSSITTPALTFSNTISQPASTAFSTTSAKVAGKTQKPDIPATIDHALFKFDDDDDDFDLDIDSFEKTNINKIEPTSQPESSKTEKNNRRSSKSFDDDFDDDFEDSRERRRNNKSEKRSKSDEETYEKNSKRRDETSSNRRKDEQNHTTKEDGTRFGPVYDILQQKNYGIINNVAVGDTIIDFVGASKDSICLCLVDKENGDWLADEEMFNGEDPLWFSESSHRVSPVCKLKNASQQLKEQLSKEGFEQNILSFVVIQMANIINADDMFEVWEDMDIEVTRVNRGAPKEIRLFSKTLNDASERMPKREFERLQNYLLKSAKRV